MIYEVNAKLLFASEDESKDFFRDCELALIKATVINPNEPNMEFSHAERLISNHELNPNEPSVLLEVIHNEPPHP